MVLLFNMVAYSYGFRLLRVLNNLETIKLTKQNVNLQKKIFKVFYIFFKIIYPRCQTSSPPPIN